MQYLTLIIVTTMLFSCTSQRLELKTVDKLDLEKYSGTWYEIARLPNSFEKGLKCITANYSLNSNGTVKVVNKGHKESEPDKISQATGKAKVPDAAVPGKLKVAFQWPFYGKYWVLKLDDDYSYAVVGTPSGKFLWILGRTPKMPADTLSELVEFCKQAGFNTDELIFVEHDCP